MAGRPAGRPDGVHGPACRGSGCGRAPHATRGEVCEILLAAADDYHSGLTAADLLKGDGSGDRAEGRPVTRRRPW